MKHHLFPDKQFFLLFMAASLGSFFLLIFIPPIWNYADSMLYLFNPPGPAVMLHYPPLYWFFLKMCNYLALQVSDPFNNNVWHQVFFAEAVSKNGLLLAIILQHLLLISSLVYFAWGGGKNLWTRLVIIIVLLANPALLLFNHGFYSESLWISFIIFQLGSSYAIATKNKIIHYHYLVYTFSFFFGILTRHISIILAPFLPLLILAIRLKRNREPVNFWFRKFSLSILATLVALTLSSLVKNKLYDSFEIEKRSTFGHVAMLRIMSFPWDKLDRSKKIQIIQDMQNRADDSLVVEAIPLAIPLDKKPSEEMQNDIYALILSKIKMPGGDNLNLTQRNKELILASQDKVLNKICRLFLTSGNPLLLQNIGWDIVKYLTISPDDISYNILNTSVRSLILYGSYGTGDPSLASIQDMIRPENASTYEMLINLLRSWPLSLIVKIRDHFLIILLVIAMILGHLKKWMQEETTLFILGCLLFALIYISVMSIIIIFHARYAIFNSVLIHLSAALFMAHSLPRLTSLFPGRNMPGSNQ